MSKVIFLDVDGVLNSPNTKNKTPRMFRGVEDRYLEQLQRIVEDTGADIVLSSDWKNLFTADDCNPGPADEDGKYLSGRLAEFGLTITARTDDKSTGDGIIGGRGCGIRKYLKEHPDVDGYVILDDILFGDFTDELLSHLVLLKTPLSKGNADKAIDILEKNT